MSLIRRQPKPTYLDFEGGNGNVRALKWEPSESKYVLKVYPIIAGYHRRRALEIFNRPS